MNARQKATVDAWKEFEGVEPEISTERLIAMVCDKTGADAGDVAEALWRSTQEENS